MRKLLLIGMFAALAFGMRAQGLINLGNISNAGNNSTPTATTGGLFWFDFDGNSSGAPPALYYIDFNVNFYGGSDANSLVLLKSLVCSGSGSAGGPGTFLDLSGQPVAIPGALTTGFFRIEAWTGGCGSAFYTTSGIRGASPIFSNPLGNPQATPPGLPTDFTGMPAIVISVPEPSTLALAGVGTAALIIFRRRK